MGLDMYAMVSMMQPDSPVGFNPDDASELHYWRKHPNLHGWMEALYRGKGGFEQFNCESVVLTAADLDRLEADIKAKRLPATSGFFFGASDGTEMEEDLTFVAKAREAIAEGKTVFYTSWW
ncbi:MAG: phosphoglycerate kinase [Alphaproteobacteria bacterium HGW-Alphaproteobacteria-5]|nr:MAG: phosphoglycerate kinase [Alphaproteobacteria bacterium HGW-Alphaproteobacteria-5]